MASMVQIVIRVSGSIAVVFALASPAYAQQSMFAQKGYVGVGVGAGHTNLNSNNIIQGHNDHDTSGKVFAGYQATPNWGIEGQYVYLGKYDFANAGAAGQYKAESWGLAGTATVPLPNNFYVMGKLGAAFNHLRDANLGGDTSRTDVLLGIAAGYRFSSNLGIRAEYENFGKMVKSITGSGSMKADNWAVSLTYSF